MKILLRFASFALFALSVSAQDSAEPRSLRILCLGDPPPFQQEVRDGVRYELDPPKGSVPPPRVSVRGLNLEGSRDSLSLRLRMASSRISYVPGEDATLILADAEGKEWLRAPLPDYSKALLILWRDRKESWQRPRLMFVSDETAGDEVRILNLTSQVMGATFGPEKVMLTPGKPKRLAFPDGATQAELSLLYSLPDQSLRSCLTTSLSAEGQSNQQFFIYAADAQKNRVPCKVVTLSGH